MASTRFMTAHVLPRSARLVATRATGSSAVSMPRRAFSMSPIAASADQDESFRLHDLLSKFKDPSSHFHIPAGTHGPAHADDHSTSKQPQPEKPPPPTPNQSTAPRIHPLDPNAPIRAVGSMRRDGSKRTGSASMAQMAAALGLTSTSPGPSASTPNGQNGHGREQTDSGTISSSNSAGIGDMLGQSAVLSPSGLRSSSSSSSSTAVISAGYDASRVAAKEWFEKEGFDTEGTMEVNVVWGEQDSFRHVNNVHFVRWIESARIRYCENFSELPKETIRGLLTGQGMGFILKDVSVKYRSPVTYPDTVLIASRIHDINQPRAYFKMGHAIWSLRDNKVAATGDSTLVMYDYDHLRKGTMSNQFRTALEARHRPAQG